MYTQSHKHNLKQDSIILPNELTNMILPDTMGHEWAVDQLLQSSNKKVMDSILMSRLYELIGGIDKNTSTIIELKGGNAIPGEKDPEDIGAPLIVPIQRIPEPSRQKVASALVSSGKKETLAYTFALQVIEWRSLCKG